MVKSAMNAFLGFLLGLAVSVSHAAVTTTAANNPFSTTIGGQVVGGTFTQVLYVDSSGNLAGDADLTFDGTTLTAAGFSGPHNGTVGATTPAAGTFTTLTAAAGTLAAPSTRLGSDTATGWYQAGANQTSYTVSGVEQFQITSVSFSLKSTVAFGWSGSVPTDVAKDTAFSRIAAGKIAAGTGAAGSVAGELHAGMLQASLGTALTLTAGAVGMSKMVASGSAPGATGLKLEVVCGTNAGSAKITALAGTSTTAVTVLDNIGSGVTGC